MNKPAKDKFEKDVKFAHRVSKFRELTGFTQTKLAPMLGVSRNYVSMIEGGRKPSETVRMLFETLESSPIYRESLVIADQNPVHAARVAAGMSIRDLAKATRYSIGVLQAVEEDRAQISEKMVDKLLKTLPAIDRATLLRNDEKAPIIGVERATVGTRPTIVTPVGMTARYVPLISWAQAGELTGVEDQYEFEGHIAFDAKDPKAFAVPIKGDSMEPNFSQGDVAIVYPSREPMNGNLVIGKTKDDEVFFKRLTIIAPNKYKFSSYNPVYLPFDRARADLVWLYPVASVHKHTL